MVDSILAGKASHNKFNLAFLENGKCSEHEDINKKSLKLRMVSSR